jgi:hypothetical protein
MSKVIVEAIELNIKNVTDSVGDCFSRQAILDLLSGLLTKAKEEKPNANISLNEAEADKVIRDIVKYILDEVEFGSEDCSISNPQFSIGYGNRLELDDYTVQIDTDWNYTADEITNQIVDKLFNSNTE